MTKGLEAFLSLVITRLAGETDEVRERFFAGLQAKYCVHCGAKPPREGRCTCRRDD